MSETPAEIPVELGVDYTFENDILKVKLNYQAAKIVAVFDWSDADHAPGEDFNFLMAVLPTAVARVHEELDRVNQELHQANQELYKS